MRKLHLRRSIPTIAIAATLVAVSATSGATAALVITGKQIKDNTVTTKDIKNGSLTASDLASSTVAGLSGDTGPAGPAGPAGSPGAVGAPGADGTDGSPGTPGTPGADGADGADGVSGWQIVHAQIAGVGGASKGGATAYCPLGQRALGGGGGPQYAMAALRMVQSSPMLAIRDQAGTPTSAVSPTGSADAWTVVVENFDIDPQGPVNAYVICADVD